MIVFVIAIYLIVCGAIGAEYHKDNPVEGIKTGIYLAIVLPITLLILLRVFLD